HVHILYDLLHRSTDAVFMLTGETGNKERDAVIQTVKNSEKNSILIATSTLIGEGFDLPDLNCLFLVMPISSESRIEQYTGRTNRSAEGKKQVKVYDYVDSQIPMAQSMYYKRLKLYKQKGYGIGSKKEEVEIVKILHNKTNFEEALLSDLRNAEKEIVLFTTNPRASRIKKYFNTLQSAAQSGCAVHYILSQDKEDEDIKALLVGTGGRVISDEHHKHFIIVDRQIVWNCSFDFFGNVAAEDFATRDINFKSAEEVLNTIALNKGEKIEGQLL
ncbi:MAG: hypothetical protein IJ252_09295, partial [Solobacterium sp.]|nr:hypothetical protein [Solobacterium sp.]